MCRFGYTPLITISDKRLKLEIFFSKDFFLESRIIEDRKKSVAFVQRRISKARISRAAPVLQRRSIYSNPTTNDDLFEDSIVIRDMNDFSDSGA